jgi:hypothetical protein
MAAEWGADDFDTGFDAFEPAPPYQRGQLPGQLRQLALHERRCVAPRVETESKT